MSVTIQHGTIQLTAQGDAVPGRVPPNTTVNSDGSWVVNPAKQINPCQMRVTSITVDPSAAVWVVVLNNFANANTVWSSKGSTETSITMSGIWDFNGIVLLTATNVTRVTLSFEYIQW